jgi:pimeloyl-ACP methyl ester carboxylesterase
MLKLQKTVVATLLLAMGPAQATLTNTASSVERDMGTFRNANGEWLFLGSTSSGRPYYMLGDQLIMLTDREGDLLVSEDGAELAITRNDDTTFKAIDLRTPDGANSVFEYTKSYDIIETTVDSGPIQLRCTYVKPLAQGPHPAVVFAHGSGPNLRSSYMYVIWKCATAGIASFACDKRGSGGSEGDLWMAGFEDLADDLIHSVRHVASSYEIDDARLGVIGISQAGWVMPIAASKEPLIQFVISISGSGMPLAVQEHYLVENNLEYGGFGDAATRLAHHMIRVANSGIRTLQSERMQQMGLVVPRLDKYFDPAPVWSELGQPTLAIFGSHDRHVPPGNSWMILNDTVMVRNPLESRVVVFRGADHGMRLSKGGFAAEPVPSELTFAPGYFSAMTSWISNDFRIQEAIAGELGEGEILVAAGAEAIHSPYASITDHFLTNVSLLFLIFLAATISIGVKPIFYRIKGGRNRESLGQREKVAWRWLQWVSLLNVCVAVAMIFTTLILLSFSSNSAGALDVIVALVLALSVIASALSIYTIYRFAIGPQSAGTFLIHGNLARVALAGTSAFPLFSLFWFIP